MCAIGAATATAAQAEDTKPLFTYSGNGTFTISGGTFQLEIQSGPLYICTGSNGTGRMGHSPANTAELTMTISGCEAPGFKCTTTGLARGHVQTTKLTATFGKLGSGKVGILLKPKVGSAFIEPTICDTESPMAWSGSLMGTLTPVETQTHSLTMGFKQSHSTQEHTKFEGTEENDHLTLEGTGEFIEGLGIETEQTLTLKEGSGQLIA